MSRAAFILAPLVAVVGIDREARAAEPKLPDGCYALSRVENAIKGNLPNNYQPWTRIRKFDVFCYGEEIHIEEPLVSFGGDITIIAERLFLKSRIDSRPMINIREFNYAESEVILPDGAKAEPTVVRSPGDTYSNSYQQYYEACLDCTKVGEEIYIPRMPDGLTPAQESLLADRSRWFRPSYPAPEAEIDEGVLLPGTIQLLIKEVDIGPLPPASAPQCPEAFADVTSPFLLLASGLNGGRGGAGSPAKCSGEATGGGRFRCVDEGYLWTSANGAPGKPGNGGRILINSFGSEAATAALRAKLAPVSTSQAGQRQSTGSFYAPRSAQDLPDLTYDHKATGSICDFFQPDRLASRFPQKPEGRVGSAFWTRLPLREAMRNYLDLIMAKDASGRYDWQFEAKEAKLKMTRYLGFPDFLVGRNVEIISASYSIVADQLFNVLADRRLTERKFSPVFTSADAVDLDVVARLPPRLASTFYELANIVPEPPRNLEETLGRLGGLFNLGSITNRQILAAEQTTEILGDVKSSLSDIQATLEHINRNVTEQLYLTRRAELNREAGEIQASLAALEAKMRAEQIGSPEFFASLTGAGEAVGSGVPTISAESVNLEGYAKGIGAIGSGVVKIIEAFSVVDYTNDLRKVETELARVRKAIADLNAQIIVERDRLANQAAEALAGQFNARLQGIRLRQKRSFLGSDLIRLAAISYFSDPTRHVGDLRINLLGTRQHLSEVTQSALFKWRDVDTECGRMQGRRLLNLHDCFEVKPSSSERFLIVDYPVDGRSLTIPLYRIAPTYRHFRLPTYGLRVRVRSDWRVNVRLGAQ